VVLELKETLLIVRSCFVLVQRTCYKSGLCVWRAVT